MTQSKLMSEFIYLHGMLELGYFEEPQILVLTISNHTMHACVGKTHKNTQKYDIQELY